MLGIQAGVNQLLDAIRPTLGPMPGFVAVQPVMESRTPEILDSGGTIARRIIQIQDRDQDVGLMFARHMLWKLQDKIGDGTATAAVLFQEILNLGIKYKAAGGNVMRLGKFLQEGMKRVLNELDCQVTQLEGQKQLVGLAESICYDTELADILGKVVETIGPYGRLEIRSGRSRTTHHEFVQGMYWEGGPISPEMILDKSEARTVYYDGAILATDLSLEEPAEVISILEAALAAGITQLLLVISTFSEKALAPLLNPRNRERIRVIAVKTPGTDLESQAANLHDMAILTGGRPVFKATQVRPEDIQAADFGYARRIWAYKDTFGITSGKGEPQALRDHVYRLQAAYRESDDADNAEKLLKRLGHLMNGSATVWIGGLNEDEQKRRKEVAENTARALRMAHMEGVLPGGGIALLNCLPIIDECLHQSTDSDEIAAYRILAQTLESPFRALMENGGYESGHILAALADTTKGHGFDLRNGNIVDMRQAGILDPARVIKEAFRSAVSSAALLLTTDVLIHKRNPVEALHTA